MNVTDEIKAHLDIVDLVSETVKLRHAGKNYTGFCPFHSNTHTPAFVVFPDTGTWRCFGACNEGGDIFKYVMKKEGLDFPDALKVLAKRAGIKLEAYTPEKKGENEQAERLRHLMEEAVIFYHSHLLQSPKGKAALQYLIEKRGLTLPTIESFGIGYAPEGWESAIQHFTGKGYTQEELTQSGLTVAREEGGFYDRFRNRILFPVRDSSGRMAGFGGRVLDPNDIPKFINSPQTVLFDKSQLLYGLDQARKPIREADQAIIVEGYLDVVVLHQEGFRNVVSPMGTALTETQMRQIKRFTRRIVMALDPDAAGIKATLRGLEIARDALDHSDDMIFDARGLIHHESRLQADLRVSTLPEGMDPDDIVRKDPEEWKIIIASAKPIITHVMTTLSTGRDLEDPKIKSQIAAQIMPLIRDIPDSVERDAYRQQLARLLHVDDRALISLSSPKKVSSSNKNKRPGSGEKPELLIISESGTKEKINTLEKNCIELLLKQPEMVYKIDRFLKLAGLENFSEKDFEDAKNQRLVKLILDSLNQDGCEPIQFIQENQNTLLDDLIVELKVSGQGEKQDQIKQPDPNKQTEEIMRTILALRQTHILIEIEQLRTMVGDALGEKEPEAILFQNQIMDHFKTRGKLDRALANPLQNAKSPQV
jgi:DNA primase